MLEKVKSNIRHRKIRSNILGDHAMNLPPAVEIITASENRWHVFDVGKMDYERCWQLQKQLVTLRKNDQIPNALILVEHPHVLTIGRHGNPENVLIKKLPLYQVERGGDVTYHGPGQLVGYFIVKLEKLYKTLRDLVEAMGTLLERITAVHGIETQWKNKPAGLWTVKTRKKIASVGMAVKDWVTFHGFALNVTTDLKYFTLINPCGMDANIMTSMQKEGCTARLPEVKATTLEAFHDLF